MAHGPDTEELLRRIANATTQLNISILNITSLPKLPDGLEILHCHNTRITSLPNLPARLQELDCHDTQITSLPKLPDGLRELDCSYTQITSLPKLPDGLRNLYCLDTRITSLPELPRGLDLLDCQGTQITSLPKLPDGLRILYCLDTRITSLPELPRGLGVLDCSNTRITSLPELPATLQWLSSLNTPLVLQRKEEESIKDYNLRWRKWRDQKQQARNLTRGEQAGILREPSRQGEGLAPPGSALERAMASGILPGEVGKFLTDRPVGESVRPAIASLKNPPAGGKRKTRRIRKRKANAKPKRT